MRANSRRMAVSGMMVALGAAVMLLGGVIPLATFCCPALAGFALIPLVFDCGRTLAWCGWAAIALLGLMLCPDKEAALLFAFLGYYPILKWDIDVRVRNPWLRRLTKFLLWNVSIGAMYALIYYVLRLDIGLEELEELGKLAGAAFFVMLVVCMLIYDFALGNLAILYEYRLRPRLMKMK